MADTYKIFSEKNNNLDRAEAFYGQMDQAC
jgi:hypothetical protein